MLNHLQISTCELPNYSYVFKTLYILGRKTYHHSTGSNSVIIFMNGFITNEKTLRTQYKIKSNYNLVYSLYKKYGIMQTLCELNGNFNIFIADYKNNKAIFANDKLGLSRVILGKDTRGDIVGFYNNLGDLCNNEKSLKTKYNTSYMNPGSYYEFNFGNSQELNITQHNYYNIFTIGDSVNVFSDIDVYNEHINYEIYDALYRAILEETDALKPDSTIHYLLSGGPASSILLGMLSLIRPDININTYCLGFKESKELGVCEQLIDKLSNDKINHRSIIIEPAEFVSAIQKTIISAETYDIHTIRTSICKQLLVKRMFDYNEPDSSDDSTGSSDDSDGSNDTTPKTVCLDPDSIQYLFTGDGCDSVTGGDLYFHCCPDEVSFDFECKRRISTYHKHDTNYIYNRYNIQVRTPYLNDKFIQCYLRIMKMLRYGSNIELCEKQLLKAAFDKNLVPYDNLWNKKETMFDGFGDTKKLIDGYIKSIYKGTEQSYYKKIFNENFNKHTEILDNYWEPRFIKFKDVSAATWDIYM